MKRNRWFPVVVTKLLVLCLLTLAGAAGCSKDVRDGGSATTTPVIPVTPPAPDTTTEVFRSDETAAVKDVAAVYAVEDTERVIRASITTYDGTYTFAQVNSDIDPDDNFVPEVDAHFQADNYPEDGLKINAKVRLRGSSSRLAVQKSYRVKLGKDIPLWRGEGTLQLNKHPWDLTRVRNKLAFDLFREIPHLPSLRTQFMQVTMNGQDFGLFTHVEKMDKYYLANRGLPTDGNIYKANEFDFRYVPGLKLDASGAPADSKAFELVLELENDNKNHTRLLEMISSVNDANQPFAGVFSKYFDRSNYLTWLAVNILVGNHDTKDQNFALYQPKESSTFFFLPWDYDGAFGFEEQPDVAAAGNLYASWQLELGNWWDVPLHRRFIQEPGNLNDLRRAVELIYNTYLADAAIRSKLERYRPLVEPFITSSPDLGNLPTAYGQGKAEWATEYNRLATTVRKNFDRFMASLEKPMPFWQSVEVSGDLLRLNWDAAVDLQNDSVTYSVQVADNPGMQSPFYAVTVSGALSRELPKPPKGTYYLRVTARDSKGYHQEAFNRYQQGQTSYFGVLQFQVQ